VLKATEVHIGDSANDKDEEQKNARAMSYMKHHAGGNSGREEGRTPEREYRKDGEG